VESTTPDVDVGSMLQFLNTWYVGFNSEINRPNLPRAELENALMLEKIYNGRCDN